MAKNLTSFLTLRHMTTWEQDKFMAKLGIGCFIATLVFLLIVALILGYVNRVV